uniref:Uncharacterized protein n=1 Tax=Glossina austeni TaxID=7395 RepID=A0A1A9V9S8_GLOAU
MCNKFKLSGNSSRASSTTVRASRGRREPVKSKANKCKLGACSVRNDKANRARCKAVSNIVPMRLFNSRGVAGALELIVKLLKDCCTFVLMVKVEPPVLLVVADKFKSDRTSVTDEHQTGGSNILLPNRRTNNKTTGSDGVVSLNMFVM